MPRPRKSYHIDNSRDGLSAERLPSGSWRVRVWDANVGKYRGVTRSTEDQARREAVSLRARFVLGQDNAATCTLEHVWDSYSRENYGLSGLDAQRLAEGRIAEPPAVNLEKLRAKPRTIESMYRVVAGLRAAGATDFKRPGFRAKVSAYFSNLELARTRSADGRIAVSTRRRMTSQVRALINYAKTSGLLPTDPLAGFRAVGDREQDDTTREVFHLNEIRLLVRLARHTDPIWVHAMLCLYAGLRDAEARAVTWNDYEKDRRLLWVQRGKGNKRRAIAVQVELADILEKVSDSMGPTAPSPSTPTTPIARPLKGRGLASFTLFVKMLAEANINRDRGLDPITAMPRRLTRHALRHTYCAVMLATGESGDNLRIMMGHGTADLTMHYGNQVAIYKADVEKEMWPRGQICYQKTVH